ncbi:hypothetical protein Javan173_0006 [Streptococcus phage Javan173]|uniref:hypothetical protein n=1 Tax=Streptococcus entericus TaxID=155680 RepID=UPI00035CF07B|nr:hypothetical protein [Streptococcus entericus]QBX15135.1 hypothetical protein Javan173_0006 [Streptococcus phage Javan173]
MNDTIQSKLAINIASKALMIATLEAQNEELQSQLGQALAQSETDKQRIEELEAENAELAEKLRLLTEGEVVE